MKWKSYSKESVALIVLLARRRRDTMFAGHFGRLIGRQEMRWDMDLEGVVHNGVIVPDDATALPEGMRVRISLTPQEEPRPFGERFAQFKGAAAGLPEDLAEQHEHYRLGTPKR